MARQAVSCVCIKRTDGCTVYEKSRDQAKAALGVPAQTEGGEKPQSAERFLAMEGFADSRAHSSTAIAELIERYVKYLQSFEPSSPATAGDVSFTFEERTQVLRYLAMNARGGTWPIDWNSDIVKRVLEKIQPATYSYVEDGR